MERTFRIFRHNPGEDDSPRYDEFTIPVEPMWTVLDALNYIKWYKDGSLAFRRSCRHGICGSCAMTIQGHNSLACEAQLATLKKDPIEVEPLRSFPVIKDLVVDMDDFFERYRAVKPYFIAGTPPTDKERLQSPEERKLLDDCWECILCGACTSSCPSYWADKDFLGPAALLKAYRFIFDSRDEGDEERMSALDNKHGLWRCHTIFNCVEACPKSLNPTRAISQLKKKVIAEKF
ncbi:MAG: succinate dehydrogenase iron-sulfur subunit [Deltaproteobacteria bacterium]|nr:succinate dehydrogenase iron-sulfur subunit [Deltaproteobacteria bacterium]